jgi:hypothetical protein
MSWFWFFVACGLLVWNVFLMRTLSIAQHDVRRLRRRLHNQGITFLEHLVGGER